MSSPLERRERAMALILRTPRLMTIGRIHNFVWSGVSVEHYTMMDLQLSS